jgi:hypothetical protein
MVPSRVSVQSVLATFGSVGSRREGAAAGDRLVDGGRHQQREPGAVGRARAIHVCVDGGGGHVIIPQRTTV